MRRSRGYSFCRHKRVTLTVTGKDTLRCERNDSTVDHRRWTNNRIGISECVRSLSPRLLCPDSVASRSVDDTCGQNSRSFPHCLVRKTGKHGGLRTHRVDGTMHEGLLVRYHTKRTNRLESQSVPMKGRGRDTRWCRHS